MSYFIVSYLSYLHGRPKPISVRSYWLESALGRYVGTFRRMRSGTPPGHHDNQAGKGTPDGKGVVLFDDKFPEAGVIEFTQDMAAQLFSKALTATVPADLDATYGDVTVRTTGKITTFKQGGVEQAFYPAEMLALFEGVKSDSPEGDVVAVIAGIHVRAVYDLDAFRALLAGSPA